MGIPLRYSVAVGPNLPLDYPAVFKGDLYKNVEEVARAGCRFVELHVRSPDMVDGREFVRRCADAGVRVSSISTGLGFADEGLSLIDDDREIRMRARARLEEMIELAASLGSGVILGLLRGRIPDKSRYRVYEGRLTESLHLLLETAAASGVYLDLEAISHVQCNYLNTAQETLKYIESVGDKRLRLLLDTYHMNMEDRDTSRSVAACGDKLAYVHYSDSNRRRPGVGRFDFTEMTRSLKAIGFVGFVGLEYVPSSKPFEELKTTLDYLQAIERMLDAEG